MRRLTVAAAAIASLTAREAHADPASMATARVRADMHDYFSGEKSEGLVFVAAGAISTTAGVTLASRKDAFPRSAGITMASIGLVEAAAGVFYYLSIDRKVAGLDARLTADPAAFQAGELDRIHGVSARFVLFKFTEVGLICAGVGMAAAGEVRGSGVLKGVGLGLAVEAASFLTLDLFAEARAHEYTAALRRFTPPRAFVAPVLSPRGDAAAGFVLGLSGRL